jgi:hypothetical protein
LPADCPERVDLVEAIHHTIASDPEAVLRRAREFRQQILDRGIDLMPWEGWPLRPFFFPLASLRSLAEQLTAALAGWRREAAQASPQQLARRLGLDLEFLSRIETAETFLAPEFASYLRPDGFFHSDRYDLVELNFANGLIVSNAYTEILADYHAQDPGLPWEGPPRPFQAYLDHLQSQLTKTCADRPLIGLLSFREEYQTIHSWEKRVADMLLLGRQLFERRGLDTVLLHERDVVLDSQGRAVVRSSGQPLDLIVQITINTSFMDRPELFESDFSLWKGARVGDTPLLSPLCGLCLDKGTLPWVAEHLPRGGPFSIEVPSTHPPTAEREVEYRLSRTEWVLKRAFDGKDTHAGCSTPGRQWNKVVARAIANGGYVMQRYRPMPTTVVPMTPDGETLHWLEVSFELSPFIIDGRFAGGAVRYAPRAPGLVMSPPPPGMGFALAAAV